MRDALEDQHAGPGFLHPARGLDQSGGCGLFAALNPVPAQRVDRLWGQAEMRPDGNVGGDDLLDGTHAGPRALDLDRLRAGFLDQSQRGVEGNFRAPLKGAEGQVGHYQRGGPDPGDACGMVEHVLDGHRECAVMALHHHAEAVPDEDHVHGCRVHDPCGVVVVRGDHDDPFASLLLREQVPMGDLLPGRVHGRLTGTRAGQRSSDHEGT